MAAWQICTGTLAAELHRGMCSAWTEATWTEAQSSDSEWGGLACSHSLQIQAAWLYDWRRYSWSCTAWTRTEWTQARSNNFGQVGEGSESFPIRQRSAWSHGGRICSAAVLQ